MAEPTAAAPPIRALFAADVTRDIPPVVYFHEQSPEKLADEVKEYIITGGWPAGHPNQKRVPNGIHEEMLRLLINIGEELDKKGGPELPNAWISGFYGSGKSSFAKLLGLALDGVKLPDGRSLAAALLDRDTAPLAGELRAAWSALRVKIDPMAVVFDIGSVGRDEEHIHSAAVRQLQARLGYSTQSVHVAGAELALEKAGRWAELEAASAQRYGAPWSQLKEDGQGHARFSNLMAALYPDVYRGERDWHMRNAGVKVNALSPEEAVKAIGDMLGQRAPQATLFFVIDEVSQYVLANADRVERLRAFATALGAGLKGRAWLLALGQQKLDEGADDAFTYKTRDRFPPRLRVHLAATNIRDVVHKRLLQKRPEAETTLRALFSQHRAALKLYAFRCEEVTPEEFVEVYPMLPGQIDLLLKITTALRLRSSRAQGDSQAIRGLLQLLGELFRSQRLAEAPVGSLVTLDQIYEVQQSALDSEAQDSMARILAERAAEANGLAVRVAKVVALLELVQDELPTHPALVAQCLYDRVDRGNQLGEVTAALDDLRRRNLLGYSEKQGYKLQSSAGEEWERERRDHGVPREAISERVREGLELVLGAPEKPRLEGRPFPWAAVLSDGRRLSDAFLLDPRDEAALRVDLRYVAQDERGEGAWIKRSAEAPLNGRIVWVCGDTGDADDLCRELERSEHMVKKYTPRQASLSPARRMLLISEQGRSEDLEGALKGALARCFMSGALYFRGRQIPPMEHGAAFATALTAVGNRLLPDIFPHFVATNLAPAELMQLLDRELSGSSTKLMEGELGILELDRGRIVPTCKGVVPQRVLEHIEHENTVTGTGLLAAFGGPPYGYTANVVKACVAGLLRAGKLRVQPEGGSELRAAHEPGAKELFEKDRAFRRANFSPAGEDDIGRPARARIAKLFADRLGHEAERDDNAIADAVTLLFPAVARRLRGVLGLLNLLPGAPPTPKALDELHKVVERAVAGSRHTHPTVQLLKKHLDALGDGLSLLALLEAELTEDAARAVRRAADVRDHQLAQLEAEGAAEGLQAAAEALQAQLSAERPYREVDALQPHLDAILAAYAAERGARLRRQEQQAEEARRAVKARPGFATLSADEAHKVLRPIALALTNTSEQSVAPPLSALDSAFAAALARAVKQADELLDALLSKDQLIVPVDLGLHNRELKSAAEVDALLVEIRRRLIEQLEAGARVRLI